MAVLGPFLLVSMREVYSSKTRPISKCRDQVGIPSHTFSTEQIFRQGDGMNKGNKYVKEMLTEDTQGGLLWLKIQQVFPRTLNLMGCSQMCCQS